MPKCLLCFSEDIVETGDDWHPFVCAECGASGKTPDDISEPDMGDEYKCGQVYRKPTDDPEDVFVPGYA